MDEHDEDILWGELHVDEIAELLGDLGVEMSPEDLQQLSLLVKQVGGLEQAWEVLEELEELERRAA
jgi:hypothetical protein